jgi:hypothetical protein
MCVHAAVHLHRLQIVQVDCAKTSAGELKHVLGAQSNQLGSFSRL